MDGIIRRREYGEIAGVQPKAYITVAGTTYANITTPITLSSNAKIEIDCFITKMGSVTNNTSFFDFTSSKTNVYKPTYRAFRYHYQGNDRTMGIGTNSSSNYIKNVDLSFVRLDLRAKTLSVDFTDGTSATTAEQTGMSAYSTAFRIRLTKFLKVASVTLYNSSGTVVHNLVATLNNGVACMFDTVTEEYYYDSLGTAYLEYL